MGHPDIVSVTKDHVMAWPNGVGLYAAYHSYLDEDFIAFSRDKILRGREMVTRHLSPPRDRTVALHKRASSTPISIATPMRSRRRWRPAMSGSAVFMTATTPIPASSMGRIEELEVFDRVFSEVYTA